MSPMIKTGDAAAKCGVSRETIRNWVERGNLPNSRAIQNPNTGKRQYLIDSRDIEEICEPDKARAESRVIAASVKMEDRAKKLEKLQRSFENTVNQFKQEFYNEKRNNNITDLTPLIQSLDELKQSVTEIKQEIRNLADKNLKPNTPPNAVNISQQKKQPVRKPVTETPPDKFARRY